MQQTTKISLARSHITKYQKKIQLLHPKAPQNLTVSDITSNKAHLKWQGKGELWINDKKYIETDMQEYDLLNLTPETDYIVKIVNNDLESNIVLFTTKAQREITNFENFSDFTEWKLQGNATNTSVSADTVNTLDGQSMKLTTTNNTNVAFVANKKINLDLSTYTAIDIAVYVDNPKDVSLIALYISNDVDQNNRATYSFIPGNLKTGYNLLTIPLMSMKKTGSFDFGSPVQAVQIRLASASTTGTTASFDRIDLVKANSANVVFIADDGKITQYTDFYRLLKANGLIGSIAVIKNRVDQDTYMTESQLKEVQNAGFELINHTENHVAMDTLSKTEQRSELVNNKNYLISLGSKSGDIVAYPFGKYNDDTLAILKTEGFRWARSLLEGFDIERPLNNYQALCQNLIPSVTADTAKKRVDEAIATGSTVVFLNHNFTTDDSDMFVDTYWKTDRFEELTAYVRQKMQDGLIRNTSLNEYINSK